MIGPTDLLHPSPTPHFKTFQVFLIYCPNIMKKFGDFNAGKRHKHLYGLKIDTCYLKARCKEFLNTGVVTSMLSPRSEHNLCWKPDSGSANQ
jgi:hypothetical protein